MPTTAPFWFPDPTLQVAQSSSPTNNAEQFVVAPACAAETEQVLKLFAACNVPGFDVVAVREVASPRLTDGFHNRLAQLQMRSSNPKFRPQYSSESNFIHRDKLVKVVKMLASPFSDPSFPDVSIMPVWHGTRREALPYLLNGGFANLASTDGGYFGKGIYGTPDAEYAWRVYAERTGVLLLCCFSFYSAYPVVAPSEMSKLLGKANFQNYDAHVAAVVPQNASDPDEKVYIPAEVGQAANSSYMEVAVFESSQALPRYIVELSPSCIPRNRIAGVISREVPLRYASLFMGREANSSELQRVLTALKNVNLLILNIEQGEAKRKDRQRLIQSEKIDSIVDKFMKSSSDVVIGEQIGEGASGVVYRAEARYLGTQVAVKRLKTTTPQFEAHLKKEALVMMRLNSPFVVRVYGMLSNPLGIIMELVLPGSLHELLQRRALTFSEQLNVCRSLTCGLKTLHDAGILHCDLKGKNILVDDLLVPKITDFGIARVRVQSETFSGSSTVLSGVGTFEWMAPELFSAPAFSTASDVYALGMVFFEIATCQLPWAKELGTQSALLRVPGWVVDGKRPAIPSSVDAGLAAIIRDCWQSKPEDRPLLTNILARLASMALLEAHPTSLSATTSCCCPSKAHSARAPTPAHSMSEPQSNSCCINVMSWCGANSTSPAANDCCIDVYHRASCDAVPEHGTCMDFNCPEIIFCCCRFGMCCQCCQCPSNWRVLNWFLAPYEAFFGWLVPANCAHLFCYDCCKSDSKRKSRVDVFKLLMGALHYTCLCPVVAALTLVLQACALPFMLPCLLCLALSRCVLRCKGMCRNAVFNTVYIPLLCMAFSFRWLWKHACSSRSCFGLARGPCRSSCRIIHGQHVFGDNYLLQSLKHGARCLLCGSVEFHDRHSCESRGSFGWYGDADESCSCSMRENCDRCSHSLILYLCGPWAFDD